MSETTTPEPNEEPAPAPEVASAGPGRGRTVVAWMVVGAWGAWAVARLAGADRLPGLGMPAAPLLALTPLAAATAPVPIICALLLRRRRAALAAGVVAVALAVAVLPRAMDGGRPAAHGPVVRIMTANLLFGEADPGRVISLVRDNDVDVLSLQELTPGGVRRYERAGLAELLPYRVVDSRWGAAGSGLYARYPLRALPSPQNTAMAMPTAEFALPDGRRVEVTAVHPVPPISAESFRDWRHDLRALPSARHTAVAAGQGPAAQPPVRILAGDFNATLDHATLRDVLGRGYVDVADQTGGGLIPTWGLAEPRPPLTIDHVLVDRRCAVRRVKVHDLPGSDHRAVFAEIRLP